MDTNDLNKQVLSLITPDPYFPQSGIVKMSNRTIRAVAEEEGFILNTIRKYKMRITDEQRIVVKIMFNRYASIFLNRVGNNHKRVIIYLHKDGVISAETLNDEETIFHYFVGIDDCISFYINDFVPTHNISTEVSTCIEMPYDKMIVLGNRKYVSPELVNCSIVDSLKESGLKYGSLNNDEEKCFDELVHETDSVIMVANGKESLGLLSLTYCKSCFWAVYPYNGINVKIKAINSTEARNKFCEFFVSCWEDEVKNSIGK